MAEISLLEPQVLQGVVSKMEVKDDLVLLKQAPKESTPFPFVSWEVTRGSRRMATVNVPNAEAYIVPRLGSQMQNAALMYLREKKTFQPTTLHWLRTAGQGASQRSNAEAAVMRELEDLNYRFDVRFEWSLWRALQGTLELRGDVDGIEARVDYMLPDSHKTTAVWSKNSTSVVDIAASFAAWRKLVQVDGQVSANTVYATSDTLSKMLDIFVQSQNQGLLSDRMKDQWFGTGQVDGFLGLNWRAQDAEYTARDGSVQRFLDHGTFLIGNYTDGRPYAMVQGPAADHEAPAGFTGRFTKSWLAPDPSDRQILLEEQALPVVYKPEQFVVSKVTFN